MEYTIQTLTNSGELIQETKLELTPNSILIQKVPESMTLESAYKSHEVIVNGLKNKCSVLTLLQGIELQVLEIKK